MKGENFYLFDETKNASINGESDYESLFSEDDIRRLTQSQGFEKRPFDHRTPLNPDLNLPAWKILIVDDEKDIITITKLALQDYKFQNGNLIFFEAHKKEEAKKILLEHEDIALIFLDVVMECNYDGLELVKFIREDLKNELIQIVLRTGQPGYAPEKEVISNYKINFYQTKAELTENKLFTLTASLLNSYHALKTIREYNKNLKKLVAEKTLDLRVKNEEYQNAIATKNKMFSIIAHDLVNPFNSLLGFSDILRTQCAELPPEKIKQFSDVIWQTSRSTYDLLYNLLEWARIQTGKIKFTPSKTYICRILKANIDLLQLQAGQKNLSLSYTCNEDISVFCDSNMINTVLRNLISNAIKFTSQGGVDVLVSVDGDVCKIEVSDTGIGISTPKLKNLFDPDLTSSSGTAGESGSGIGLMLCREFTIINSGSIDVSSKINKGSTFTVKLPLYKS
jgi:signal transduction histidine kinase